MERLFPQLFEKVRDTKGPFHAKVGTIAGRNGKELTEAEEIKKQWQACTELYQGSGDPPLETPNLGSAHSL